MSVKLFMSMIVHGLSDIYGEKPVAYQSQLCFDRRGEVRNYV